MEIEGLAEGVARRLQPLPWTAGLKLEELGALREALARPGAGGVQSRLLGDIERELAERREAEGSKKEEGKHEGEYSKAQRDFLDHHPRRGPGSEHRKAPPTMGQR